MSRERLFLWDASAVLALLLGEAGAERVEETIDGAAIHTVNLAEVVAKLARKGVPAGEARDLLDELALDAVDQLSVDEACAAGEFHAAGREWGLSLGDAVCLAFASRNGMTAVTCDRAWIAAGERLGAKVMCVR